MIQTKQKISKEKIEELFWKFKESYEDWAGFPLESTTRNGVQKEITAMSDRLTTEIYDNASRLTKLAHDIFELKDELNESESPSKVGNYEVDLERYYQELYCSNCSNDSKETFTYSRTVANGEVYWCDDCKEEHIVREQPNPDNY